MRVSRNWLRDYVPVEGSAEDLAATFAELGLEVDGIERVGEGLDGIVVARVLEVRAHPDADRIRLVDVDAGDGEALQICCGADNMSAGDLVPLATVGTTMPGGMEIAVRRMRGEVSNGMLCSASELGFGTDHSGIMLLGAELVPGTPLSEALGIQADVVWDLDVLPNRPDALSMVGIARDVAARLGLPLTLPEAAAAGSGTPSDELVSVEILDPGLCGRFTARVLSGASLDASPAWIQQRLLAAGMRPINGVVDVSNYVMLELGQPNHTFDMAEVAGAAFRIRRAHEGEVLTTLDGVERTLRTEDGVVADGEDRAVALAGVMGGLHTEISAATTDVLLEVAWWDPQSVAVTAAAHNLHSEASLRNKRGVDTAIAPLAVERLCGLMAEVCGASPHPGMVDAHGRLPAPERIRVRPDRVNLVLGTSLSASEITGLLAPIGFVGETAGDDLVVTVPSWRLDSSSEIDVVEEVGRMFGLSRLPRTVPPTTSGGSLDVRQRRRRSIRHALVGRGLTEAMPLPFLAPGDLERCGLPAQGFRVANPLAAEESVLRTSLRPGLLGAVAHNAARRRPGVALFEIGRVFGPGAVEVDRERSVALDRVVTGERESLAAAVAGAEATLAVGLLEVVLAAAGAGPLALRAEELPGLHPGRGAVVEVAGLALGEVGEIDPAVAGSMDIAERVAWLELDLGALLDLPATVAHARPVSRYPSSDVDVAFVVDEHVPAAVVAATIRSAGGDLVDRVDLFDVFRSESLGEGRRSTAFRVRFQALDRTLTDAEVAGLRSAIIEEVERTHGAELRG